MSKIISEIRLNDVRLSFPSIFSPKVWPSSSAIKPVVPKYEATFILDAIEHQKEIKLINDEADGLFSIMKTNRNKIKADNLPLKDGNLLNRDEYNNKFTLKATSLKRFPIVGRDGKTPITEADNIIYAGCHVIAYISLWSYSSPNMGVSANLRALQFSKNGEPFGQSTFDIDSNFYPLSDEDDPFN
jgi:hypothetical protein